MLLRTREVGSRQRRTKAWSSECRPSAAYLVLGPWGHLLFGLGHCSGLCADSKACPLGGISAWGPSDKCECLHTISLHRCRCPRLNSKKKILGGWNYRFYDLVIKTEESAFFVGIKSKMDYFIASRILELEKVDRINTSQIYALVWFIYFKFSLVRLLMWSEIFRIDIFASEYSFLMHNLLELMHIFCRFDVFKQLCIEITSSFIINHTRVLWLWYVHLYSLIRLHLVLCGFEVILCIFWWLHLLPDWRLIELSGFLEETEKVRLLSLWNRHLRHCRQWGSLRRRRETHSLFFLSGYTRWKHSLARVIARWQLWFLLRWGLQPHRGWLDAQGVSASLLLPFSRQTHLV